MLAAFADELLHVLASGLAVCRAGIGHYGEFILTGESDHIPLVHIEHRTQHLQSGLVQLRHRREAVVAPFKEQVHHAGLDEVVLVVGVGDFCAAQVKRRLVEGALAHFCAQRAGVLLLAFLEDDLIDLRLYMVEGHVLPGAEIRHALDVLGGHACTHIHVNRMQLKCRRIEAPQHRQTRQKTQAVLAAGQADGNLVARLNHVIPLDALAQQAGQPLQIHGHYRLAPIFSRCSRAASALPGLVFSSVMGMLRSFARAHRGA